MEIINFGEKKRIPLTSKEYRKVKNHCHYSGKCGGAAHSIFNFKYSLPKEIPALFCTGPNNDYNFIIKELAFALQARVPIRKEVKTVHKNRKEITKAISCTL